MTKALSVPSTIKKVQYSFTPNTIRAQADSELSLAFEVGKAGSPEPAYPSKFV
jgi:hypothetical protein